MAVRTLRRVPQRKTLVQGEYDIEADGEISMIQVVVDLFNEIMCTDCAEEDAMQKKLATTSRQSPSTKSKRRRPSTLSSRRNFVSDLDEQPRRYLTPQAALVVPQQAQQPSHQRCDHTQSAAREQRQQPSDDISYITADDILRGSADVTREDRGDTAQPVVQQPLRADGTYDAVPHAPHETSSPKPSSPPPTPLPAASTEVLAYDLLTDALAQAGSDPSLDQRPSNVTSELKPEKKDTEEEEEEEEDTRRGRDEAPQLQPASQLLRGVQEYHIDTSLQGSLERSYDAVWDALPAPPVPQATPFAQSVAAPADRPAPQEAISLRPANAYNFQPNGAVEALAASSPASVYNSVAAGSRAGGNAPLSRRTGLGMGDATAPPTSITTSSSPVAQRESKFWDESWKQAFDEKFSLALDSVEKTRGRHSLGHPQCLANEVCIDLNRSVWSETSYACSKGGQTTTTRSTSRWCS
jgi:hypothetical protein